MQNLQGRPAQIIATAIVAAVLLIGAPGCGSSDAGVDGGTERTTADPSAAGSDSEADADVDAGSDDDAASGKLPDPCDLVPIEMASQILGGESAEPDASSEDVGMATMACTWQTQDGIDNPTLDGAGHILTLTVISAPESMSMDEFWEASKAESDEDAEVAGCDDAFWIGGLLSALRNGVYLTGTAGLADDSPAAKASATSLLETACASL